MTSTDTVHEGERLARVVLSRATEPGDLTVASLLTQMSAGDAVRSQSVPKARSGLHLRLAEVDPVGELERAARLGIRFVIPGDDEWPAQLDDLDHAGLDWLGMGGAPVGLWVRGPMSLAGLTDSIAVVGSRSASAYGVEVANNMAATLAVAGRVVVSGGAFGIDEAAHRGAVAAGGSTVAVLACGVDRAYPEAHKPLLDRLARESCVISEAAPGCSVTRLRFLVRNRLIAALSQATVLVEAARRSGALNTGSWANELGRTVLGVPGPVTVAQSVGVHDAIRTGAATLVTNGQEVLEMVSPAGEHLVEIPREPERPRDRLSPKDQQVLEAVPLVRPAGIESIARTARTHVRDTDTALRRLRDAGFVELVDRHWRQAVPGS